MQSVSQGSIIESEGLSLGIVFNVHVLRESQRGCYRKEMINPWGNILLKFFFLRWFKFFVVSAPKEILYDQKIDPCPRIVDFSKAIYSFQFHMISIKVSFNGWVYDSFECSSSRWFLIRVDWVLLITNLDKIRCLQQ